jgi:eukaryotic-like serine/threonine-protein kinase
MAAPESPVESIFFEALAKASPEERAAYLTEACGGDPELRHRVERLLRAQPRVGSFLQGDLPGSAATVDEPPVCETLGTMIGPYKLLQQIGEGGMGTVFMAEQTQPVQRKVALKVIKAGLDSRQVIARFEAERQALALMDHVNIARVLDAGATESGRPYFVMELVHGVPITKYCDDNRLTPRERLELFVPVCQAIQHAHQKGVIHRDVKPSNVMVTLYDGKPVPKVIDFGVAKATEQKLTERTLFTQYGTMVGTLEYMSPEQAEMSALGADTRSDIFSLGVLLYELLTGSTPLTHKRVREAAYAEILRMIKEEEPPRPSTRLSDSGEALASISAQRHMEPAKLTKLVKGELDWIVMKCLEKDRNRRYETASAFAADVQRYLNDEPVQACPPSAGYRLRKFVRRNKGLVLAASLVFLAVLAGAGLAAWQAVRATQAEAVTRVEQGKVIQERDEKDTALQQKIKALSQKEVALTEARQEKERADGNLEKVNEAVEKYLLRAAENPRLKSADLHDLRKDLLTSAVPYYEEFVKQKGDDPKLEAKRGMAYYALALLRAETGERKQAQADYEQAQAIFGRLTADLPTRTRDRQLLGYCHNALGNLFLELGKLTEAEEAYGKALAMQKKLADEVPASPHYRLELAGTHNNLGILYRQQNDPAKAEAHHTEALALRKKLAEDFAELPQCRRDLARSHGNIGHLRMDQGKHKEAEAHHLQALDLQEKLTKDFPGVPDYRSDLGKVHQNLGNLMVAQSNPAEAEAHYRQAVALLAKLTEDFPRIPEYRSVLALSQHNLGILLRALGKLTEAEEAYGKALAIRERLADDFREVPEYRSELAHSYNSLGLLLRQRDRLPEAETAFGHAVDLTRELAKEFRSSAKYQIDLGMWLGNLALLRMDRGRLPEARQLLQQAITHKQAALKVDPTHAEYRLSLHTGWLTLAGVLKQLGERGEAETAYRQSLEVFQESPADFRSRPGVQSDLAATLNDLSLLLMDRGEVAKARRLLEEAVEHQQLALQAQPRHPPYRQFLRHHYANLAKALGRLGEHVELARVAEKLSEVFPENPAGWYEAAGALALCVSLTAKDATQTPGQRDELAKAYADRAIRMLRTAVQKGFKDAGHLKQNPDLDPLRSRADFKELLAELEAKAKE